MIFPPDLLIPIAHAQEAAAPSGIASLGLNLKLFIAQLINFALILLVLWKWVFTPLSKKLQERTDRIEKAMHDAASTEKEKQEFGHWKELEMTRVRSQASAIVAAAESQAQKAKASIEQETKQEQEKIIAQAKTQIEQEKNQALASAKGELADLVTSAAEKIIRHKLDASKDKELIKESLSQIK